ncbi:MAG: FUSC family protein, partial [Acidimicrobiales bacterium]
ADHEPAAGEDNRDGNGDDNGNVGRSAGAGGATWGPGGWRPAAAEASPNVGVVLHRYASAIDVLAGALEGWSVAAAVAAERPAPPAGQQFRPAVTLRAGWLPGTADVSAEASRGPGKRVHLAPYVRTTAQMTVAVSVAIVAGNALDAQRFYWAVVAALLTLVGTNTVAEQLRKATYRVVGTLVGVVAGTALVDAVGTRSIWSLVVVVTSIWIGMYLFRVNYAFMAMAITVSLSQAYLSLGEFSGGLLGERLAETAVGAGAAMVTVLVVVPLRTRRVLDVAAADLVDSLAGLANAAAACIHPDDSLGMAPVGPTTPTDLRAAGRDVDAAYQALVATAEPLRLVSWADSQDRVARLVAAATAARNYGRNLAFDSVDAGPEGVDARTLSAARQVLAASAASLAARLRSSGNQTAFTRAGALFGAVECALVTPTGQPSPTVLVLRDLGLLDATLAALARGAGMSVRSLDQEPGGGGGTARVGTAASGNGRAEATRPTPGKSGA